MISTCCSFNQFVCLRVDICVEGGCYTPESSVEHPGAVAALAEEFAWAGADITQTFTYYSRSGYTMGSSELSVRQCLRLGL